MGDNVDLLMSERIDQIGEVEHMIRTEIRAVGRPVAIAMSAQVGRDHVPVMPERARGPVPTARMIAPTVYENEQRRTVVSPVYVVELQSLRDKS
jgi:hypothetical protein